MEGYFRIIVDAVAALLATGDLDARCLELPPLLERGNAARLLELLLSCLALRLLAASVGETRTCLRQHLFLVLIHVDGVGACWFRLRVRIDLTWPEAARVVAILATLCRLVQQPFVVFQTLCCRAPNNRRNRAPLCWHQLRKVEELLLLLP